MDLHLRLAALAATVALLLLVLELVRQRRLLERYALVWMAVTGGLILLSVWDGLLTGVASLIGIAYPPSALFVLASFFILVVLLHYSTVISKLSDQNRILAQRLALLENELEGREHRPE